MLGWFLRHRLVLTLLLVSAVIGAVCAKKNISGNLLVGAATSHVAVDFPDASIINRSAGPQDLQTLQEHAVLYGRLMTTPPVLADIAHRAGVPANELSGTVDLTGNFPVSLTQVGSEQHATELRNSNAPYRLEMQASTIEPVLTIYAEAPSYDEAMRLANGAVPGLEDYLRSVAAAQGTQASALPQLQQLGGARGGVTNNHAKDVIAALTFITAFTLSFVILLVLIRKPWRSRDPEPVPAQRTRLSARGAANWPRTSRMLPWSVAGLIMMVWLTPFDRIQLQASGPVNITLDRIVLPFVFAIWLISFTAGPGAAPRLRVTRVHVAIGVYLACAFLSTVLDAHYLNHVGELMLALKKLPLLISYMSVFVIVASSVRREEVPAFLTFTLVLAVIVSLGTIYEYRWHQNLFTTLASKIFIGPFTLVGGDTATSVDSLGRRWVEGPSAYGVELVAMLATALPIAVLGILKSKSRRQYILYGLAVAVLLYAMIATDRKSALVAPGAVFLTLAYFRRRQLLSLAPLGLVLVVFLAATSPAAIRNVVSQYTSADAGHVATVSSRTANYDAVRPDLWSHLLLGRGQGTYAPPTDRIVDSDIILPLVETGVLGLVAILMIPGSLILLCRRTASRHESQWSGAAVTGVAAGVCFLSVMMLYSVMSLPHAPNVFFYMAGLAVVAVGPEDIPLIRARRRTPVATQHDQREVLRAHRRVSHPRGMT
ncbi:MAG: O-antigen ligase family protein, partial [Solirubrobacteraceae bacterium]